MIIDSPIISGSLASTGSLTQIGNVVITGSLSVSGPIKGNITGSADSASFATSASYSQNADLLDGLNSTAFVYTSSYNQDSSSFSLRVTNTELTGSSLVTASGSFSTRVTTLENSSASFAQQSGSNSVRLTNLEVTASVLTTASASFAVVSSSFALTSGSDSTRITNLESTASILTTASGSFAVVSSSFSTTSGSLSTRVTTLESASSSFAIVSQSFSSTSQSVSNRVSVIESSYATTGSNIFSGTQGVSNVSNAISFTSTASLYLDGGARITKDLYVSGTSYFNNVTIYGTQSVNYITSSQLNIGTNIITVNTDTPTVRYGGLAVYDSGSTGLTGSLLWDSENNHWIYTNPSASTYSGGMLISGPRASARGCEVGTTSCALMMGQGGDHITSSAIFHYGNATCIPNTLAGGVGCFSGAVCAPIGVFTNSGNTYATSGLILGSSGVSSGYISTTDNLYIKPNQTQNTTDGFVAIQNCTGNTVIQLHTNGCSYFNAGNVGIGTSAPLFIAGFTTLQVTGTTNGLVYVTGTCSTGGHLYAGNGLVNVGASSSHPLAINTSDTPRITISSTGIACFSCQVCMPVLLASGCVGIGTTSPNTILEASQSTNADAAIKITNSNAGTGATAQFFANNGTNQTQFFHTGVNWSGGAGVTNYTSLGGIYNTANGIAFSAQGASGVILFGTGTSQTERLRITSTGIACFACQICTTSAALSGNVVFNRASTSAGNNIEWRTTSTLNWYIGTRGLVNNNFYFVNEGLGANNLVLDATSGVATFACNVTVNSTITAAQSTAETSAIVASSGWSGTINNPIITFGRVALAVAGQIGYDDPNTGLYIGTCTNHRLAIRTNNTDRLVISNTGVACFSSTVCAPSAILTAINSITVSAGSNIINSIYSGTDGNWFTIQNAGGILYFGLENSSSTTFGATAYAGTLYLTGARNLEIFTSSQKRMTITSTGIACFACQVCSGASIFASTNMRVSTGTTAGNSSDPAITTGGCTKVGIYFAGGCVGLGASGNGVLLAPGGHLVPEANGTQDLGSSNCRWCTVYTSDLSLNNGIGNYTIVEGENDLFLYNNNSCKVFKFVVQEVCPEIAPAKRSI